MTALIGFLPGGWEIWVILAVVLLLFGHRIPAMARSMGSGIVEFKKGLKDGEEDSTEEISSADSPKVTVEKGAEKAPQDSGKTNG